MWGLSQALARGFRSCFLRAECQFQLFDRLLGLRRLFQYQQMRQAAILGVYSHRVTVERARESGVEWRESGLEEVVGFWCLAEDLWDNFGKKRVLFGVDVEEGRSNGNCWYKNGCWEGVWEGGLTWQLSK